MDGGVKVRVLQEGAKHAAVEVSGSVSGNSAISLFCLKDLSHNPKSLRLDSVTFSFQEKLGVLLKWGDRLILPLDGRGKLDFSSVGGLRPPDKDFVWDGMIVGEFSSSDTLEVPKLKHFLIVLEWEKYS
ncbi:MAG: hypothetical protein ACRD22_19150 [Terriglobia bacterium]